MRQNEQNKNDYVSVIYNKKDKPFTQYPERLIRYIIKRYDLTKDMKVLDLGCGRGDFLREFMRCGLKGHGADQSLAAKTICPDAEILKSNIQD